MAGNSLIEWIDATWNPVTGCSKISPGCKFCYAERMALRLQAMGQRNYRSGFELTLQPDMLEHPLHWRTPRRIFVNSMSDLFHEGVPVDYIRRVFDIMRRASWHQYQVLTKRSGRLTELDSELDWQPQIWMGVSVETAAYVKRIDHLRQTHAAVRFLSIEPLLARLGKLDLSGIDWVIVGGESGPGACSMGAPGIRCPHLCHPRRARGARRGQLSPTSGPSVRGRMHCPPHCAIRAGARRARRGLPLRGVGLCLSPVGGVAVCWRVTWLRVGDWIRY